MKEYRFRVPFTGTEIAVIDAETIEEANKKLIDGDWDEWWDETMDSDIEDSSLLSVTEERDGQ